MKRTILIVTAMLLITGFGAVAASETERLFALAGAVDSEDSSAVRKPTGLAAGSDTELAVADAHGNRLVVFRFQDPDWIVQRTVQLPATPLSVAHDGRRYLVSLREGKGLMAVEGERHTLRPVPLAAGVVAGAVAGVPGGGFLVYDSAGHQVLRLDPAGKADGATPVDTGVVGLAASRGSGFFAAFPALGEIRSYDAGGQQAASWTMPAVEPVPAWPVSLVQIGGELLALDRHGGRMVLFDSKNRTEGVGGRRGWEPGLLWFPSALAAFPDGRVAVADQMNGRVQIYQRVEE